MTRNLETLTPPWTDDEFVDSGDGKKLERFGEFTLVGLEPQAKGDQALSAEQWKAAHAEFVKTGRGQQGE